MCASGLLHFLVTLKLGFHHWASSWTRLQRKYQIGVMSRVLWGVGFYDRQRAVIKTGCRSPGIELAQRSSTCSWCLRFDSGPRSRSSNLWSRCFRFLVHARGHDH